MLSFEGKQAANNNEANAGPALQVRKSHEAGAEVDTLTALNDAVLRAYGYNFGTSEMAQAQRYTIADREAAAAALLKHVSSMAIERPGA